ncbi:MAG: hypothetical protein SFV55_00655 [Haliscomenobacter sp.]|uniref:hypothetical protein n=1 Tax=Haliscomenobacter sp. TaxID=2717303 RepID=UPI0029B47F95|nr:hypothetical protein [Haliscomenobacter sp.]MDX2066897.1 hypothetical protein [Haliscomenobacter sp.]
MAFKSFLFLLGLFLVVSLNSCDVFTKTLCGEVQGRQKVFIDSVNAVYEDRFVLSQVPCYPGYLRADLKTNIESKDLDSLEIAYNRLFGFAELLVYDQDKNLIRGSTGSM